jgi:hypothetical protein
MLWINVLLCSLSFSPSIDKRQSKNWEILDRGKRIKTRKRGAKNLSADKERRLKDDDEIWCETRQ